MPEGPQRPQIARMQRLVAPRLNADEEGRLLRALPKDLTEDQATALREAAHTAIARYRAHRDTLNTKWSSQKLTRPVIEELAALGGAARGLEEGLRGLSEEAQGWLRALGYDRTDEWADAATQARHAADDTTKQLETLRGGPGKATDHAALLAGSALAQDWREVTGRGTRYRKIGDHGPFSLFLQAVIRIAKNDPTFDGAKLARQVAETTTISSDA